MRGTRVGIKPNTPEWLAWRALGITAGDAATILGLSPWGSPFDLWWQKTSDRRALADSLVLEEPPRPQRFEIGHAVEPMLEKFYRAEAMPEGYRIGSGGCWQGRGALDWLRATPDRMVYSDGRTRTPSLLVEFKTSGSFGAFGEDSGDGVPDIPVQYRVQMIHQMLTCGLSEGVLTALTPSMAVKHYHVAATEDELHMVLDAVEAFEKSLRTGTPPDVDDHEATTRRLKALWQDVEAEPVTVPDELAAELLDADLDYKAAKKRLDLAKNQLLKALGNGTQALASDGTKVASRSVTRRKASDHQAVRAALDALAGTFPFDPRALVAVAPEPTVTLRVTTPRKKPQPITEETP